MIAIRTTRLVGFLVTGLAGITAFAVMRPAVSAQAPRHVTGFSITILSTMLADEGFGEWGFAALVEADGRRILFDTGANDDTVQRNVKALGLDLSNVDTVVISHNHADHTTGLIPLRRQLAASAPKALATLYAGKGLFLPRIVAEGRVDDRMTGMRRDYEASGGRVVEVSAPTELQPGVWLTGPVPRVHPERNWSRLGRVRGESGDVEDTVPEDMALVLNTDQGLIYLLGCGHAGVINTLEHGRRAIDPAGVRAVIGGLHLFAADEAHLAWTATQMKAFGVQQLVGAHCTGVEAVYRLRELAGLTRQTCMVGAVGASYSSKTGINALRIAK
jgi:7,8-dihydropterin-6-yl-methyl-4-(beta-D-ribofuranosyl)aminobenzene 5'-phosphate synthase